MRSIKVLREGRERTLQMPQATVHSSLVADAWLAWHSIPAMMTFGQYARSLAPEPREVARTEIHNMVAADRAIVDDDVPCPQSDGIPL